MKFVRQAIILISIGTGTFFGLLIGLIFNSFVYGAISFAATSIFTMFLLCANYSG